MIHCVVLCPGVPALLPGVAPRVRTQLEDLVEAGRSALTALEGADRVVVLVDGVPEPVDLPEGALVRSGVGRPGGTPGDEGPQLPDLPVAAAVGAWWLSTAGPFRPSVTTVCSPPGPGVHPTGWWDGPERVAVVAVADGGIRHGEHAPGAAHPAADDHLSGLVTSLAAGDPVGLQTATDSAVAADDPPVALPVWRELARLPRPDRAAVLYAAAPFGVGYVVARWSWPDQAVA